MANKEVKIAVIVGAIMITICIVAFLIQNYNTKKIYENDNNIKNLEVYKSYQLDTGREYIRCNTTTEELTEINSFFKKVSKLKEEKKEIGQQIIGTYMIRYGENDYIAFDADETNYIYVSINGMQAIFKYESEIYEMVAKTCSV